MTLEQETNDEPVLQIIGLQKRFGSKIALSAIGLEIERGKSAVLTGESGSGKTTLLRLIAGLEMPDAGVIRVAGQTVSATNPHAFVGPHLRGAGMVFQDLGLWPNLTVKETLRLTLGTHLESPAKRNRLVDEQVQIFRLDGMAQQRVASLSGGEQQRLALARSTIRKPELLMLDEPFVGLDILLKRSLFDALNDLRRETGVTILSVVHSPQDATGLAPDIIHFLNEGQIAESIEWSMFSTVEPRSSLARAWKEVHSNEI